jgi:hypothetical protein
MNSVFWRTFRTGLPYTLIGGVLAGALWISPIQVTKNATTSVTTTTMLRSQTSKPVMTTPVMAPQQTRSAVAMTTEPCRSEQDRYTRASILYDTVDESDATRLAAAGQQLQQSADKFDACMNNAYGR